MSNYPPERESAHNSDEDGSGHDDDEENDEEDEEEVVDWTELTALDEIDALEDGPSTFLVGGFSTCQHLGDAVDRVKYKEDVVVIFPGVYTAARASTATATTALELNEAALGGLRIYGVSYAREHVGRPAADTTAVPKYAAVSKRRVGPWFTWLTAAATMALLKEEGSGEGGSNGGGVSGASRKGNPLKVAASRAIAATDRPASGVGHGGAAPSAVTTTSGSHVFAAAITATTANAALFPIFDFPITFCYAASEGTSAGGLPHYKQEAGDDAAGEERGEEEEEEEPQEPVNDDDDDDDATGSRGGAAGKAGGTPRGERAITFAGCCARAGIQLNPLTRTVVTHCVVGASAAAAASPLRIALTAAGLTEALVDHCLVFGGTAYGIYAYPRAALTVHSTLVEGANAEADHVCGATAAAASSGVGATGSGCGAAGVAGGQSVMALLEHRRARAQRLRAFIDVDEAESVEDGDSSAGSAYVDVEEGVLPRFVVPQTPPTCEVGVMIDDADVRLEDCFISHTRLGVLIHDACGGTKVRGLDVRSCTEAGLYLYGLAGAAEVVNSIVRACGRACLLVVGPSPAEVAAAAAACEIDGGDDDMDDDADGGVPRRPVLAQHPYLKANTFIGAVRVQGEVRTGAVVNNFVFLPKEEKSAAAVATAAQTLLTVEAPARRGFTFVGVEGERVVGRAADQTASVR